ncbi:hypothetical protein ACHAAC_00140 [Aeromicrobium sp. CF4.19]|uniref:hypothetical protein n=1 Tax=Aeromicrobium sp. CF4.19 TaxID=3373082 RepID=UPI003EE7DDAD
MHARWRNRVGIALLGLGLVVSTATGSSAAAAPDAADEQTRVEAAAQVDAAAKAQSCVGNRVALMRHRAYGGNRVANTGVYRSGNNWCAVTVKVGNLYGKWSRMSLSLRARDGRSDLDRGRFQYSAGPVRVNNARCVYTDVAMWNRQGAEILQDYSYGGFGSCP